MLHASEEVGWVTLLLGFATHPWYTSDGTL
mgnify:CR=1 FL=1